MGRRLRALAPEGAPPGPPEISVVVPVNAQGDLQNVLCLLSDLSGYRGPRTLEVTLVVNNYSPPDPPPAAASLRELGVRVLAIPDVRKPGEAVGFSARLPGLRAARSDWVALFDADCRIPRPTALLDWYADRFREGAQAAYSHVAYYDFKRTSALYTKLVIHHGTRWVKRNVLRIPTTRGSNYAVLRRPMLELYEEGLLADEMNVGPTFKRRKGRVAYSGAPELTVFTSGRMFSGRWSRLLPYYAYRLRYNLRVLPVRAGVARFTGRESDPVRRYVDNRPVRDD